VNIYKNKEKKTDKSPDYTLYLKPMAEQTSEPAKKEEDDF
jgi:hypothetical protein